MKEADIILVGVSRTSKTPTSIYLANKGYKVGNLPIVLNTIIPKEFFEIKGLTQELTRTHGVLVELSNCEIVIATIAERLLLGSYLPRGGSGGSRAAAYARPGELRTGRKKDDPHR